ncbi:MAG: hypothetical protein ACNS62_22120 [Candidatus Cyclobacteriaceae bacterium M3_2C_046]
MEKLFVLYTYYPNMAVYFEQTDVLTFEQNVPLELIMEDICLKNSCSDNEVEIIDYFYSKSTLNQYLQQNGMNYLRV